MGMYWYQWVLCVIFVAFFLPFFVYLFSRIQMRAWCDAFENWNYKKDEKLKGGEINGD